MPMVNSEIPPVSLLAQRMLWNRTDGGAPRPLPIVILLGPTGAGKTHALTAISRDCGAGVVHARYDFGRGQSDELGPGRPATVDVLAQVAFNLSRDWTARPRVQFTRFALGMIATRTPLARLSHQQAKERLRAEIDAFAHNNKVEAFATETVSTIGSVVKHANLVGGPVLETTMTVLPRLLRTVARKPLGEAKRWHADIPQAEGSAPIDALIALSQLADERHQEMTDWLVAAFLADVRESYRRMARPDSRSPCACANPEKLRHWHSWPLLLDNIDHAGGDSFIADLRNARDRHLDRQPQDHDPLLVIATSGRWNRQWESDWRPPWLAGPGTSGRLRTVLRCRAADYQHWLGGPAAERPRSKYYPVLLEPLSLDETARILGTSRYSPACDLVQRATGGLPAAVTSLAPLVRGRELPPGARDVLGPASPPESDADLWRTRLDGLGLVPELPDAGRIEITDFVSAAPFATAFWLIPADATSISSHPQIGRILTELRTALWVTTPVPDEVPSDYAELHPWVARVLVSALARRPPGADLPTYAEQFMALLGDPETARDPARKAYCQLALGHFSDVVAAFESSFDTESHRIWADRLKLVTRAPDNLPLNRSCAELFQELVNRDIGNTPARSPIRNIVARLVAATWLAANPFAVADRKQRDEIADAYKDLRPLSRRPDVSDLHE